jgi:hypothetical protein
VSKRISPGGQQFRADDGAADPAVTRALDEWQAGRGTERDAIAALHASRLLVPVVAILGEQDASGADKTSEMALPKLIGQDGRPAIIAFTSTESLARWRADARPVPAEAPRVWQAAITEQAAVVIDVAGPVPFVVEGARLAAVAAGNPPPLPHEDPDLAHYISTKLADLSSITAIRLEPSGQADLAVRLSMAGPDAGRQREIAAERIAEAVAGRVRAVEITTE